MEIGEIISDAFMYPINNIKALLVYIVLTIIMALVLVFSGVGLIGATGTSGALAGGLGIVGIIGIIIAILIALLIEGYMLDVLKIGIDKGDNAPEIDIARQVINGIKYLVLIFVYMIIPFIIMLLLGQINSTLGLIVGIILMIVFAFALLMGACRLAKTGSLGEALNIPEAIKDITKVGVVKILLILIVFIVISMIVSLIVSLFGGLGDIGSLIGAIINGIVNAYLLFFYNRSIGLAYSDI